MRRSLFGILLVLFAMSSMAQTKKMLNINLHVTEMFFNNDTGISYDNAFRCNCTAIDTNGFICHPISSVRIDVYWIPNGVSNLDLMQFPPYLKQPVKVIFTDSLGKCNNITMPYGEGEYCFYYSKDGYDTAKSYQIFLTGNKNKDARTELAYGGNCKAHYRFSDSVLYGCVELKKKAAKSGVRIIQH